MVRKHVNPAIANNLIHRARQLGRINRVLCTRPIAVLRRKRTGIIAMMPLSSFDVIMCVSLSRFSRILLQVETGVKLLSPLEVK